MLRHKEKNLKLKVFTVMHASSFFQLVLQKTKNAGLRHMLRILVCNCQIDGRSNYSSCSAQNKLADVEKTRMKN